MRTLKFIVNGQIIEPDPNCDFSGLVPGTSGYLQAKFSFSDDWKNCIKVAGFYSMLGKEYQPQLLKDGESCMIPAEALKKKAFKIRLGGKRGDFLIQTDKVTVYQNGGKA